MYWRRHSNYVVNEDNSLKRVMGFQQESHHLETAKWLYNLGGSDGFPTRGCVNINALDDHAFTWSCRNAHIETAKRLFSLDGMNIHAHDDVAFSWSCHYHHIDVVEWLFTIDKFDNKVIAKAILNNLERNKTDLILLLCDQFFQSSGFPSENYRLTISNIKTTNEILIKCSK